MTIEGSAESSHVHVNSTHVDHGMPTYVPQQSADAVSHQKFGQGFGRGFGAGFGQGNLLIDAVRRLLSRRRR
ncbi:hypothetical protein [Kineosporia succinea]|uniref:Uncharacterized protein n=1 Tax=Kineosporia succinea TaxID=84632 RepID=A0ABT9NYI2_9ACTN|nr:hypothetical protein [Kineosporia succinea]MDP9825361.1 hypothetical protein [Kineosporia succinea]